MSVIDPLDRLVRTDALVECQISGSRLIDAEERRDEKQRKDRETGSGGEEAGTIGHLQS